MRNITSQGKVKVGDLGVDGQTKPREGGVGGEKGVQSKRDGGFPGGTTATWEEEEVLELAKGKEVGSRTDPPVEPRFVGTWQAEMAAAR